MRCLPALLVVLLLAPTAQGWMAGPDRPHHADLAEAAAGQLPEGWRAALLGQREALRKGAMDPDGILDPEKGVHTFYHTYEPADGGGGGVYRVGLSLQEATMAVREGKPAYDVAYQMGFLTHFIADLSMPFHTGADLYDDAWHERYEQLAYDRRAEYATMPSRAPQEVEDVEAYAIGVAQRSAALGESLVAALDASGGEWSPEARDLSEQIARHAVEASADMLYTAFARADPARPAPTFADDMPVPKEPEDLGLSVAELGRRYPWGVAAAGFALLAALVAVGAYVARRRAG